MTSRPLVSSLNYVPGDVLPNAVIVPLNAGGQVTALTVAAANVIFGADHKRPVQGHWYGWADKMGGPTRPRLTNQNQRARLAERYGLPASIALPRPRCGPGAHGLWHLDDGL